MADPKIIGACAYGIDTGSARTNASDKARHQARIDSCGENSVAEVRGQPIAYMNKMAADSCEEDAGQEICKYYGTFKELGYIPANNKIQCTLFQIDSVICSQRLEYKDAEPKTLKPATKPADETAKPGNDMHDMEEDIKELRNISDGHDKTIKEIENGTADPKASHDKLQDKLDNLDF